MRSFIQYHTVLINSNLTYRLGIGLWHLGFRRPWVHQIQVFLHTNSLMMSQILNPTDQVPHMCGRHSYRLAWRGQAFKVYQYSQTFCWMTWNTAANMLRQSILVENATQMCGSKLWVKSSCCKYAAPGYILIMTVANVFR